MAENPALRLTEYVAVLNGGGRRDGEEWAIPELLPVLRFAEAQPITATWTKQTEPTQVTVTYVEYTLRYYQGHPSRNDEGRYNYDYERHDTPA